MVISKTIAERANEDPVFDMARFDCVKRPSVSQFDCQEMTVTATRALTAAYVSISRRWGHRIAGRIADSRDLR
jgi:hypothetical protein